MSHKVVARAASELLDEGGPEAVTLREVGARAGVSRGAPYGHFADKAEMLTEVASRVHEQYLGVVAELVGGPDARPYGALLMSSAHGIASLELSGHLAEDKWQVDGDQLVHLLVDAIRSGPGASPGKGRDSG